MRNNQWLNQKLEFIWKNFFSDIKKVNPVEISFGRNSKRRFGSIKLNRKLTFLNKKVTPKDKSIITINGYFKSYKIPEFILDLTIAHELAHYAHGFNSAHARNLRYPHQGGVVDKELLDRGLKNMLKLHKQWVKENWQNFLNEEESNGR
ncbi:MAG: hypothetical protein WCW17_03365 [Patescibacteria group bacterium]|jgi:hypothetical protein